MNEILEELLHTIWQMLIMRRRLFSGQSRFNPTKVKRLGRMVPNSTFPVSKRSIYYWNRVTSDKKKRLEFSLKLTFDSLILFCVLNNDIYLVRRICPLLFLMKIKRGEMELFWVSLLLFYEPTLFPENYEIVNDSNSIEKVCGVIFSWEINLMGQEYAFTFLQY